MSIYSHLATNEVESPQTNNNSRHSLITKYYLPRIFTSSTKQSLLDEEVKKICRS